MDVHHVWDALIFMKLAVETCWNQHVPTILGGSYRIKPSQTLTSGVQGDRRWKHCPFGPRSERAFGGKEMAQGRGPRVWSLQHDQHSARIYRILGVPLSFCWFYLDVRTFPSFNRVLFGSGNERKLCCVLVPQNTFDRVGSKWCGQRCWPCCELIVPFSISIALEPFFFPFSGWRVLKWSMTGGHPIWGPSRITEIINHESWSKDTMKLAPKWNFQKQQFGLGVFLARWRPSVSYTFPLILLWFGNATETSLP